LIVDPVTGRKEAYTRISTVASTLDDGIGLFKWKMSNAMAGFRLNPALSDRFAAASSYDEEGRILDEAIELAGGNAKRDFGSAMHEAIEYHHAGQHAMIPDFLAADVAAYREAMLGCRVLEQEAFGVVHRLRLAGSWDMKAECPDGKVRVFDIKTGKYKAQACRIQLAAYAMAENYPGGGTVAVEQDYGVVISLPGDGTCTLYRVDLQLGREELDFALMLRQHRAYARSERSVPVDWPKQEGWLHALIADASSREELRALWAQHRGVWGAEETGLANARLLAIGGEAA
jgi:hypothetical protein